MFWAYADETTTYRESTFFLILVGAAGTWLVATFLGTEFLCDEKRGQKSEPATTDRVKAVYHSQGATHLKNFAILVACGFALFSLLLLFASSLFLKADGESDRPCRWYERNTVGLTNINSIKPDQTLVFDGFDDISVDVCTTKSVDWADVTIAGSMLVKNGFPFTEADRLAGISFVGGNLAIRNFKRPAEAELRHVKRVEGILNISNLQATTRFGMPDLEFAGGIRVQNVSILEELTFPKLTQVGIHGIHIEADALVSLSTNTFPKLLAVDGPLVVKGASLITVFLPALASLGGLQLLGSVAAEPTKSLAVTSTIEGTVARRQVLLRNVSTLGAATSFFILNNDGIEQLDFASLTRLRDLDVEGNAILSSLKGFGALDVTGQLRVTNNPFLREAGFVCFFPELRSNANATVRCSYDGTSRLCSDCRCPPSTTEFLPPLLRVPPEELAQELEGCNGT